jgi:beta-glucosidase
MRTVRFSLDRRALAYWDDAAHRWAAAAGAFTVLVGRSAGDIRLSAGLRLTASARFDGPGRPAVRLSRASTVKDLLAHDGARLILDRHVPGFSTNPQLGFAQGFSLAQVAAFAAQTFHEDVLRAIEADLAELD